MSLVKPEMPRRSVVTALDCIWDPDGRGKKSIVLISDRVPVRLSVCWLGRSFSMLERGKIGRQRFIFLWDGAAWNARPGGPFFQAAVFSGAEAILLQERFFVKEKF